MEDRRTRPILKLMIQLIITVLTGYNRIRTRISKSKNDNSYTIDTRTVCILKDTTSYKEDMNWTLKN